MDHQGEWADAGYHQFRLLVLSSCQLTVAAGRFSIIRYSGREVDVKDLKISEIPKT